MDYQLHDAKSAARARIASTAPKTTYGKQKNKLLPLTGNHFIRSDIAGLASNGDGLVPQTDRSFGAIHQPSDASDSPLSDAEQAAAVPTEQVTLPRRQDTAFQRQKSAQQARRSPGHEPGPNIQSDQLGSIVRGVRIDLNEEPSKVRHPARQSGKAAKSNATSKQNSKTTGVKRRRLPLNELILVPETDQNVDVNKAASQHREASTRGTISSPAQALLYEGISSDDGATPAKRKAKLPLTSIRKRLRTPTSGYKTLVRRHKGQNSAALTPTCSYTKQIVGDGFQGSELEYRSGLRIVRSHSRKPHDRLIQGMQALSLASGPLPDVDFGVSSTAQLQMTPNNENRHFEDKAPPDAESDVAPLYPISTKDPEPRSNDHVSFSEAAQRIITAQLSSISAPRRERSVSVGSSGDDEDTDDEEEVEDDEAADTYLDQDEFMGEGEDAFATEANRHDEHMSSSSDSPEPTSPTNRSCFTIDDTHPALRRLHNAGSILRQPRPPTFRQTSVSQKWGFNEVGEKIDDDFQVDDMLLSNRDGVHTIEDKDIEMSRHTRNPSRISQGNTIDRSSTSSRLQVGFDRTSSMQPRSILKNSAPHVPSKNDAPESTAANTCRNNMVEVEESRYFTFAKDQLDSSPTRQPIIRKKSSSKRAYSPVLVPYSDNFVPETSSDKAAFADRSHLHTLRHTSEATWTSSAAPAPARDLKDLTESVSRGNGTLSQAVRRRASLPFQSPFKND